MTWATEPLRWPVGRRDDSGGELRSHTTLMGNMMRKTTTLAAGTAALALVLGGCGGGDDSADGGNGGSGGSEGGNGETGSVGNLFQDAGKLADTASQNTSDKKSAQFDGTMSMAGQKLTYDGEGEFGKEPKIAMNIAMGQQKTETIMVGDTMYTQVGKNQYMKMDAGQLTGQGGGAQTAEMNDPTKLLDFVQKAGEITDSEQTQVGGEDATHYKVNLDFQKMADEMGALTGGQAAQQLKGIDADIPMQVWLNNEQLPVKMTMDMSELMKQAAQKSGGQAQQMAQGGMTMEMNYSDWGKPVNVEEPPASQVQEAPAGGMGGMQGGGQQMPN